MVLILSTAEAGAAPGGVDPRLQAVMQQLQSGQPVTVVAIGGSITTGYAAVPPRERGWAALVAAWLAERGSVRFVNAGVSGTDSAAAVQRVQAQVLAEKPDVVFTEFGVNDEWLDPRVRAGSYEGLLRRLLSAPHAPVVVPLLLTQKGNQPRTTVALQQQLAVHYGLTAIDFGAWMQQRVEAGTARWDTLYDEPVHPNARGHEAIAAAVIDTLEAAWMSAPRPASSPAQALSQRPATVPLAPPLHGHAHDHVHTFAGGKLQPWRNHGFVRGGEVHPEWAALPGGQQPGWTTTSDDGQLAFLVWGTEVAIFHAESEHYRNLEAWVDDGEPVTVQGHVPERRGYLGWHYRVVGLGLEPGAHLLHVRVKRDAFAGSRRPASLLAVMAAGVMQPGLQNKDFEPRPVAERSKDEQAGHWVPAKHPQLSWIGRFDTQDPAGTLMSWSGSELRARFSGTRLALRMVATQGTSHYTVELDGRRHVLVVHGEGPQDWQLRDALAPGPHELRLVKRTEGAMAEARLLGLMLSADGQLLEPPPPRALRLMFYGDSITAGACNGDMGIDQYDDFSTHDGTRAYGALTAQRLGADYIGIAISGTGITQTWGEVLMPQVWNRRAPHANAPLAAPDPRAPDVVVVNLGQNDHGFPATRGLPFATDFTPRYLAFVRLLRQRYPQARLVLAIGGMSAWKEQPALQRTLAESAARLRAEGDTKVWTYTFEAFAWAHPRIDVHAQMADELTAFLRDEVLK